MKALAYLEINRSKFYGYVFNIKSEKEFDNILNELKIIHKKATHFTYCYLMYENNQQHLKKSDANEPNNAATKGMVNLIQKNHLNNIAFIVVRYFGGVKLGGSKLLQSYNKTICQAYNEFIKTNSIQ